MKKIIIGIFVPVMMAILFGLVMGRVVYRIYLETIEDSLSSEKLYLVKSGTYANYDSMREENNLNNYVYYRDDGGYNTVVGITKNYDNIEKIRSLYSDKLDVSEYYISSDMIDSKQEEYDYILSNTEDIYEVREVVDNILNLYQNNDLVKLISIDT